MSLLKRFRILDQKKKAVLEGESLKYKLNFPTGSYIVPLHLIYRYINLTSRRGPYSTLISIIILITGSHRIVMISDTVLPDLIIGLLTQDYCFLRAS